MTGERALSRRSVLRSAATASALAAVGVAGGLSGCTSTARRSTGRRTAVSEDRPTGDVALLTRSLADEERLLAYCTAVATRHPAVAAKVEPVRRLQRQHVAVMRRALSAASGRLAGDHPPVAVGSAAVQAQLVGLVRHAEQRRLADCHAAESGLLACMFASLSAAHAVTVDQFGAHR